MNKKKILFITPSIWAGGTHSSLCSLFGKYNSDLWDLDVFAIVNIGKRECAYSNNLLKGNFILTAISCKLSDANGFRKYVVAIIKIYNRILIYLHVDLFTFIAKRVAQNLQRKGSYDTVIGFMEGRATALASYFECQNKIAWIHCNYNKYLPQGKSEESLYSKFNHIVCVSNHTASVFKERYPKLVDYTLGIYNMLDTERIRTLSEEPIDDKRFVTDRFTILSVGRVTAVKQFRLIPSIARQLKDKGLIFHWYLIGPEFDHGEVKSILENTAKFNVSDYFTWLGGKLNPYPYYKASNLYVCVSESEACPMVFNEARIFGLPIVSTNFPSAKEFVIDGEDGALVNIDSIASAIAERIIDTTKYQKECAQSRAHFIDNDAIMNQIESII